MADVCSFGPNNRVTHPHLLIIGNVILRCLDIENTSCGFFLEDSLRGGLFSRRLRLWRPIASRDRKGSRQRQAQQGKVRVAWVFLRSHRCLSWDIRIHVRVTISRVFTEYWAVTKPSERSQEFGGESRVSHSRFSELACNSDLISAVLNPPPPFRW